MDRVLCGIDEAEAGILGAVVTRFEFVQGETEEEDYIILDFADKRDSEGRGPNPITLYASAPSFYRDLTEDERV